MKLIITTISALTLAAGAARAQTNIDPAGKFSWSENCGWMNWRDAGSPAGTQGAFIHATYLSGFVWGENIGWINLGDASPAGGIVYANATGDDFGVNIDFDTGNLSGLAWGENVGWLNFSAAAPLGDQFAARITKTLPRRLQGYVWGENIGWVNLSSSEPGKFVLIRDCAADYNRDGFVDPDDLSDFIADYFSIPPAPTVDWDGSGFIDPDDLSDYIAVFFGGCP